MRSRDGSPYLASAAGGVAGYGHGVWRRNQALLKNALHLRRLLGHPSRQLDREVQSSRGWSGLKKGLWESQPSVVFRAVAPEEGGSRES